MAMITCPKCGQQVSDKAKNCVHCGAILIQEEKRVCSECGAELEAGATECPNCGCPVEDIAVQENDEQPQKVELTGVKVARKVKLIISIMIAVLLAAGTIVFGVNQYQKKKAAEEYAKRVEEYSSNLEMAVYTMILGAGEAETSGNLIKRVWNNAIYEKRDDETDQYTRPKGYFVSDFNDALGNLFADSSFKRQLDSIKKNQDNVDTLMKELKNPPDEYRDAYDAVSELYNAYLSLMNCATDPSGSLKTYAETFNNADTKTINAFKTMKIYLED